MHADQDCELTGLDANNGGGGGVLNLAPHSPTEEPSPPPIGFVAQENRGKVFGDRPGQASIVLGVLSLIRRAVLRISEENPSVVWP
ncbi:hypothetical protein C8R45DRAFT_1103484 [Mycena sanguinolenta]|nr:hypothetical protein C8R45DRAFT_1103484 [Mycena sanguinolenta]